MNRRHGPILRTALAGSLVFVGFTALHAGDLAHATARGLVIPFLLGILYMQFVEYGLHRYAMHRGLPLLRHVRRNHLEHHRIFHGPNFRTRDGAHLAHIPGRWWISPVLFTGHYAVATSVLPVVQAMGFLTACYLHYLAFELTHWFTHLDENAFDRVLAKIPVLAPIRAYQIEHHRIHHETPVVAFNFNPPYLGDVVADRIPAPGRRGAIVPEPVARPVVAAVVPPPPAPVLRRRLLLRPLLLYGTALLLGAAAVGVAVLAHSKSTSGSAAPRAKG